MHHYLLLFFFILRKWRLELANAFKAIRNPSLLRALIKMFGAKYGFYGFLLFIDEIIFK